MKNGLYCLITLLVVSCQTGDKQEAKQEVTCDDIAINDFQSFLTIQANTPEKELKQILGKSTGGSFSDDKTIFIYEFEGTKRVPVKVYVNAETGNIETVFMEILGLQNDFDRDVKKAKLDFPISECKAKLFGKQPKEIIDFFGFPQEDNLQADNVEADVRTLTYLSENQKTAVRFNFYPSQNYQLSSMVVDWY